MPSCRSLSEEAFVPWSIVLGQLDPMGKSYIGQDFFREINFTEKNRIVTNRVHKIGFWALPGISSRKKNVLLGKLNNAFHVMSFLKFNRNKI